MTIGKAVDTVNEARKYIDCLGDFAQNAEPSDRFLGPSEANHLAAVLKNIVDIVSDTEMA